SPNYRIGLFEASSRFGGRIETKTLNGFNCEFGPMRYELGIQPLLNELLRKTLGLKDEEIPVFPPFSTIVADWPQYKLLPDEKDPKTGKDYNALQLLLLALLRIFKDTRWWNFPGGNPNDPNDPAHGPWLTSLYEDDKYPEIRKEACLNDVPLWTLGFWNALS